MFTIDKRSITTSIAIAIMPFIKEEDKAPQDKVEYYYHILLDMAVGALNSGVKNIDDAIELQLDRYPEDMQVPFLREALHYLMVDMKRQFIKSGFDGRLKYKIYNRECGMRSIQGIGMDLDATLDAMASKSKTEEVNQADVINENPTLEQLADFLNTW